MISAKIMCEDALDCLGWPYVSPGSNNSSGIDCSGLFVYLYKQQGAHIYHGSNTIWREYTTSNKGKLTSTNQLKPGYAVFKNRAWSDSDKDKNNRWYKKDQWGNMYHIGLVRSISPFIIEHATSAGKKCVVEQTNTKGWTYYAEMKNVDYSGEGGDPTKMETMIVTCTPGESVKLRKTPNSVNNSNVIAKVPNGTEVLAGDEQNGWRPVNYKGMDGYMMSKFLAYPDTQETGQISEDNPPVAIYLPYKLAYELRDILVNAIGNG